MTFETENHGNFHSVAAAERVPRAPGIQPVRLGVLPLSRKKTGGMSCYSAATSRWCALSVIIKHVVTDNYDPDNTTSWDVRRFSAIGQGSVSTLCEYPCSSPLYAGDRTFGFFMEDLGPHRSLVTHCSKKLRQRYHCIAHRCDHSRPAACGDHGSIGMLRASLSGSSSPWSGL
jgi:hypothetical protein